MDDPEDEHPSSQQLLMESQDAADETPAENVFAAPSIDIGRILCGESYSHHSAIPRTVADDMTTECVLGVDEAGRGPVLGPMVYALYYLPLSMHRSLLAETHQFDDSKALTAVVRSQLMQKVCDPQSDLYQHSGWATRVMSARDISAAQLRPNRTYNLNAQAMDATVNLIQEVLNTGVNIREIYIDTIGPPDSYQRKLSLIFPALSITVAKKADSLYPCVSAASVCAKVTRDAALDVLSTAYSETDGTTWGSGYPSDARTANWLKANMNPLFGWGNECRFSWGTSKELLEAPGAPCQVAWPDGEDDSDDMKLGSFLFGARESGTGNELATWYGRQATEEVF